MSLLMYYIYIDAFFATFKFVGIWCAQQRTMTPCRSKTSSSLASASGPTPTPPPRPSTKANQSKRTPNESEQEVIKKAKATACKSPATITKEHPTPKQIQFPCKHEFPLPQASPIQPPTTPPTSKAPVICGDIASSSEVPEEFLTAWKEAVRSQSRTQKNHLLHAGGSWAMCLDQTLSIYVQQLSVVCIRGLSDYVEQLVISRLKIVHERSTEDRNRARRRMGPLAKDVFEEVVCWCQNQ